jgi:NDP-sugar pyrophosphorylase family protein
MEEIIKKWHPQKADDELRPLRSDEITQLTAQFNTSSDWNNVYVTDGFKASNVHRCSFEGRVEIGAFSNDTLRHGNITLKVGLYGSHFRDCSIGNNTAIHNLLYGSNLLIGDGVIILNVNEISCGENASFGMGTSRLNTSIELINENGGRAVLPFPGMTCTDAFLWSAMRADTELMSRLTEITHKSCEEICPQKAIIAQSAVILNVKAIRDTLMGPYCVIDGAELITNSTILSDNTEPTKLGAAVQIKNSIIGYGSEINSAAQLSYVVTGTAVSLSQSTRVCHSFIGDNSVIACCEIANSLVMPFHSQHHNNSFLIASIVGGQSNIAAGATIGSNHNSRTNDGELWAKRGFWPGLCTSFKHNCSFASFTMAAKGDYQSELDIKLPFSLLALDHKTGVPVIFPAFWFTHDMYATMRNAQKFIKRDKRVPREHQQFIEHEILAPDTVEEIFEALYLIELWTGEASFTAKGAFLADITLDEFIIEGKKVLLEDPALCSTFEINAKNVERGRDKTALKNVSGAYNMYRSMIRYYCAKNLLPFMQENRVASFNELRSNLGSFIENSCEEWINCGSMVISENTLSEIIRLIKKPQTKTWSDIHSLFDSVSQDYKIIKTAHSLYALAKLEGTSLQEMQEESFWSFLQKVCEDCKTIAALTLSSRAKDFSDPFRTFVYKSEEEMICVLGSIEDSVVKQTAEEMEKLIALAAQYSMEPETAGGDDFLS